MGTLTGCIAKARGVLSAEDEAAILDHAERLAQAGGETQANSRAALQAVRDALAARRAEAEGKLAQAESAKLKQTVYHGSPHKFDKFDSSQIGTGEGAQAYGHGLYLADSKQVAKSYSDIKPSALLPERRSFLGQELEPGTWEYKAASLLDGDRTLAGVRKEVQGWIANAKPTDDVEGYKRTLEILNRATRKSDFKRLKPLPNLYRVDLPDEMIARMLDWDKPLSQQAPEVQKAIESVVNDAIKPYKRLDGTSGFWAWIGGQQKMFATKDAAISAVRENYNGIDLINVLAGKLSVTNPSPLSGNEQASQALRQAGIPGIKYLDRGSRAAGEGSHNYVVFPGEEHNLTILDRNGEPVSAAVKQDVLAQLAQNTEPQRGGYNPATRMISLLEHADLSTFLHESGHFFLDALSDLAAMPDAPAEIVADFAAAAKWAGVTIEEWRADSAEYAATGKIPDRLRTAHERWAEGFEQYLFEGKAPSVELRGVFHRFRAWLTQVYGSLKGFMAGRNLRVSDEIRGVMDRMLATDEQIAEAEHIAGFEAIYRTAAEAGMSPDEWEAYQARNREAHDAAIDSMQTRSLRDLKWATRAYGKALRELQAGAEDLRKATHAEVKAEVENTPVERARAVIRAVRTTSPEDKAALADWNARRDAERDRATAAVKAEFAAAPEAQGLRGIELGQYLAKNARLIRNEAERRVLLWERENRRPMPSLSAPDMDVIAEATGFSSGDELRRALMESPTARDLIEGETERRLLERHGDLVTPAGIAQAAAEAVHNEARARFVATELATAEKALAVKADTGRTTRGGRRVTVNAAVQAAKQFAETLVNRRPIGEIRPAGHRQAETRAAKAAQRAVIKGDQAGVVAAKRDQLLQHYASIYSTQALAEVDKGVEYLRKFDREGTRKNLPADYLDQIDALLERYDLRASTTVRTMARRESLSAWAAQQMEQGLEVDVPQALLDDAAKKSYKQLTLDDFRGLVDTVKQVEHLGRLKSRLLTAKDKREFQAVVTEVADSIVANAGDRTAETRTPNTLPAQQLLRLKEFWASHIKAATWARVMDGGRDGGPMWERLIRPANAAGDREVAMRAEAARHIAGLLAPVLKQGDMHGKGRYFAHVGRSFNREAILAMALNTGNEGNLQRLLGGEGWTIDKLQPMLDTLTAADWQFVQAVWDHFESYRPAIAEKIKDVGGVEPQWAVPTPRDVTTADGQTVALRGGYYPIRYDVRASERAAQFAAADEASMMLHKAYTASTTKRSYLKARAEEVNGRPLLYALDGIYNGLNEVIHDLSWHRWLIDATRLLRAPAIAEAVRTKYGPEVLSELKAWVDDVAVGERKAAARGEAFGSWVRQGVSIAGLGFNVMSAAIQPLGISNSIVRIGPKWVGRGIAKFAASNFAGVDEVYSKSSFMAHRAETRLRELAEVRAQVKGQGTVRRAIDAGAYALMLRGQQIVDIPTWWGAYEKAISEGAGDERAVALADQAVIDSQGSGTIKDLSAVERGGPMAKLLTVFYSYMNMTLNQGVQRTMNADTVAKKAGLGADYALLFVVPAVLGYLLRNALTPGDSGDDENNIVRKLIGEQLGFLLGLVFGVRELGGVVANQIKGEPYGTDYGGPAGLRLVSDITKLTKQVGQGDADDALRKALINVAGDLLRLPSAQINRTITGAEALSTGDTQNPWALVGGYQHP